MKAFLAVLIFTLSITVSKAQNSRNKFVKFSVGRVAFGTGDVMGYSFSTELSKNVRKHINLGIEATIENGSRQPELTEVLRSFNQVSNISITPKFNYYPFNRIAKGFNIGAGPTIGYQHKSVESQWTILYDQNGNPFFRRSFLEYSNEVFVGYRISLNYDFNFKKGFLLGLRSDFSNNNKGDINTLLAIKAGFSFR